MALTVDTGHGLGWFYTTGNASIVCIITLGSSKLSWKWRRALKKTSILYTRPFLNIVFHFCWLYLYKGTTKIKSIERVPRTAQCIRYCIQLVMPIYDVCIISIISISIFSQFD